MSPAGVSGTPDTADEACRGGAMSRIQYLSSSTTLDLHVHMGGDRWRTRRFGRKKKTRRDQSIVCAKIKLMDAAGPKEGMYTHDKEIIYENEHADRVQVVEYPPPPPSPPSPSPPSAGVTRTTGLLPPSCVTPRSAATSAAATALHLHHYPQLQLQHEDDLPPTVRHAVNATVPNGGAATTTTTVLVLQELVATDPAAAGAAAAAQQLTLTAAAAAAASFRAG
ncbi:hypothetical protein G5I_14596 [Acromyrmex echinatior]|uniref:Protein grainyhead n=1 Tax=Acromyrmex echinatior TaxID=103372 RepID=F4X857_ACREC|nr:hypothetical protein G5I_14596 [Acromyrmex echinatior]